MKMKLPELKHWLWLRLLRPDADTDAAMKIIADLVDAERRRGLAQGRKEGRRTAIKNLRELAEHVNADTPEARRTVLVTIQQAADRLSTGRMSSSTEIQLSHPEDFVIDEAVQILRSRGYEAVSAPVPVKLAPREFQIMSHVRWKEPDDSLVIPKTIAERVKDARKSAVGGGKHEAARRKLRTGRIG